MGLTDKYFNEQTTRHQMCILFCIIFVEDFIKEVFSMAINIFLL